MPACPKCGRGPYQEGGWSDGAGNTGTFAECQGCGYTSKHLLTGGDGGSTVVLLSTPPRYISHPYWSKEVSISGGAAGTGMPRGGDPSGPHDPHFADARGRLHRLPDASATDAQPWWRRLLSRLQN